MRRGNPRGEFRNPGYEMKVIAVVTLYLYPADPAFKICWITHPTLIFRPIMGTSRQFVMNCHVAILFYSLHVTCTYSTNIARKLLFIPLASSGTYHFSYLSFTYHFLIKIKLHIMLYLIHSIQTLTSSSQQS